MHLAHLRLRDFRNISGLDLDFSPGFHVLMGRNGQGKTNILEAIYLLASLRSFRGAGGAQMIRTGQAGYFVGGAVQSSGRHQLRLYWSAKERKLTLNREPVRKLTDYLGVLRVVVFCSEDMLLIKGSARIRRRFMDLLLTQTDAAYLPLLQRYAKTLRSRNALLKRPQSDPDILDGFSLELVRLGDDIIRRRHTLIPKLSPLVRLAYRRIAGDAEEIHLAYSPSVKADFAVELAQSRSREARYRATVVGPHRDDLKLDLNGRPITDFGSEGQKRTLAISLKIAQAEYLTGLHGTPPILLIDDVMGELDLDRRSGLMPLLSRSDKAGGQVFMTCTERNWPEELAKKSTFWTVENGSLSCRGVSPQITI